MSASTSPQSTSTVIAGDSSSRSLALLGAALMVVSLFLFATASLYTAAGAQHSRDASTAALSGAALLVVGLLFAFWGLWQRLGILVAPVVDRAEAELQAHPSTRP